MAVHEPGAIWPVRPQPGFPYVRTQDKKTVVLAMPDREKPGWMLFFSLDRKDARLLAKRLNQCLDETRSK